MSERKFLAFRFDVDSVKCTEVGIPRLIKVGEELGVRFSFFLNMGYSFNWGVNLRHMVRKRLHGSSAAPAPRAPSLPAKVKLGWDGILKTMFLNPRLGERYRGVFDELHEKGHELALHGGTDHVIWQRALGSLSEAQVDDLLRPAYETFESRYGKPRGFASPGFVHNDIVLELLDRYEFDYSSDMPGETPFRPSNGREFRHYQVPVNVKGSDNVPLVEQGLAVGRSEDEIIDQAVQRISERNFALMYGHPFVEGVHADLLRKVIERVSDTHEVVTVAQYLDHWKEQHG